MTTTLAYVRVCSVHDIPLHEGRVVRAGRRAIAIFRTVHGFHALDNACPHLGGPLADGLVTDTTVACPLHERRFDLADGRALGRDCGDVAAHAVEVRGDDVFISLAALTTTSRGPS